MLRTFALSLGFAAFAAPVLADGHADLADAVVGTWTSIGCEIRPQANAADPSAAPTPSYLTRDFSYDAEGGFTGLITVFADPACTVRLVSYDFAGDIIWHGPNPAVAGAYSNDYVLNAGLTLTPFAQPFADQLNSLPPGACGEGAYEVGVPKDILGQPCALLRFVEGSEFVIDHDLLFVHPDAPGFLFMGGKHVDGTGFYSPEYRPTVGLQQPLIRVDG